MIVPKTCNELLVRDIQVQIMTSNIENSLGVTDPFAALFTPRSESGPCTFTLFTESRWEFPSARCCRHRCCIRQSVTISLLHLEVKASSYSFYASTSVHTLFHQPAPPTFECASCERKDVRVALTSRVLTAWKRHSVASNLVGVTFPGYFHLSIYISTYI